MRRSVGTAVAAVGTMGLVGAFAFVGPGLADSEFRNKYDKTQVVHDCGDDATITYDGPLKMWPPNHKLQEVSITATDGDAEPALDETTLAVTFAVTDAAGGDGGPQHDPDVIPGAPATGNPSATVPVQIRSERSGRSGPDGQRVYDLTANATFDNGTSQCSHTFQVVVPHDMSGGADWK